MKTEERIARLRITLDRPENSSGRIEVHLLLQLLNSLNRALGRVGEDLQTELADVSPAELVGLERGSTRLVFEQIARSEYNAAIPLDILGKSLVKMTRGGEVPPILSAETRDTLEETFLEFAALHASIGGSWVRLSPTPNEDIGEYSEVTLRPLDTFESKSLHEEPGETEENALDESPSEETPSEPPQWRVNFTGEHVRLDKRRQMWVRHQGKTVSMPLSQETFEEADSDEARWKMVRISALSREPGPGKVFEVLSIEPTADLLPDEVIPMSDAALKVQPAIEHVKRLEGLSPNWDSYKAKPPSAKAIAATREFLLLLASEAIMRKRQWELPFIAPVANGSIQLEWEQDEIGLELEFLPNGHIELFRFAGDDTAEGTANRMEALKWVAWFHERTQA